MIKGLTRILGLFLFLLFISGAVLVPAYHTAHCGDHVAATGNDDCPICQLGNTPTIAGVSLHSFDSACLFVCFLQVNSLMAVLPPLGSSAQARAPPAG